MKELVQANMLQFIDEIGRLLVGQQFAYVDLRGTRYPSKRLQSAPTLQVSPEGFMYTSVDMGGIVTSFTTYTLKEGGNLIASGEDVCRTWFTFTKKSHAGEAVKVLKVRTHYPHPITHGYSTVRCFLVGSY